jgi:hypothetical protein
LFDLSKRDDGGLWQIAEADLTADDGELPHELRRHTRFAIPESLIMELLDEDGNVVANEVSVTENISLGGAAIFTSFDVEAGTFIRVRSETHDVTIISIVRGRHTGSDGISRLHIEFVDQHFPLHGVTA